jgi:uncharacterized protein YndB with AHSA1/START domain
MSARFERLYDATPSELWSALTEPEQLRGWLAQVERLELSRGGGYELRFDDSSITGRVLALDPGRMLELTWSHGDEPHSVVRFEIVSAPPGTVLVLEHTFLPAGEAAGHGAGWQSHLEALGHLLGGGDSGEARDWWERYRELLPVYERAAAAV